MNRQTKNGAPVYSIINKLLDANFLCIGITELAEFVSNYDVLMTQKQI